MEIVNKHGLDSRMADEWLEGVKEREDGWYWMEEIASSAEGLGGLKACKNKR